MSGSCAGPFGCWSNPLGMTGLRDLYLIDAPVTDECSAFLGTLTNLRDLDLSGTQITGARFSEFKALTELDTLRLWATLPNPDSLVAMRLGYVAGDF